MSRQFVLDLPVRASQSGEDFLIAPSNEDAAAWLDSWPDWPAPMLVLTGPPGCGKSHLAAALGYRIGPAARTVEATALAAGDPDVLMPPGGHATVDRADDAAEAGRLNEAALFHLFNLAKERGGTGLLLARRPPSAWPLALQDLKSRLATAPVAAVAPPDDNLLAAVIVKQFNDRQIHIAPEVLSYVVPRLERSFAAAGAFVAAADRMSLSELRRITIPVARAVLSRHASSD